MDTEVAEHALTHGLTEDEVRYAWEHALRKQHRPAPDEDYAAAVGTTRTGKLVQMVGVLTKDGYLVIHALEPPTNNVLKELGLAR